MADVLQTYVDGASKGDVHAAFNASLMYARGVGCARDRPLALRYLTQAAEGDVVAAQAQLAYLHATGRGGVEARDAARARDWYARAGAGGDADALYRLGAMHRKGEGGPRDDDAALECWTRAAELGHARARDRAASAYGAQAPEGAPPPRPSLLAELCRGLCRRPAASLLRRLRGDARGVESQAKPRPDAVVAAETLAAPLLDDGGDVV